MVNGPEMLLPVMRGRQHLRLHRYDPAMDAFLLPAPPPTSMSAPAGIATARSSAGTRKARCPPFPPARPGQALSPAIRWCPSHPKGRIPCQARRDAAVLVGDWPGAEPRSVGELLLSEAPATEAIAYQPTATLRPSQPLQRRQQARDDFRMSFLHLR